MILISSLSVLAFIVFLSDTLGLRGARAPIGHPVYPIGQNEPHFPFRQRLKKLEIARLPMEVFGDERAEELREEANHVAEKVSLIKEFRNLITNYLVGPEPPPGGLAFSFGSMNSDGKVKLMNLRGNI